jgi:hypothetical protein
LKNNFNFFVHFLFTIFSFSCFAQHDIKLVVAVNKKSNSLQVYQTVTYHNQSKDTLTSIYFNDWNNAYSDKNSALGKRFSDEFVRSFHLASEEDRGATSNLTIFDDNKSFYAWNRLEKDVDLLHLDLKNPLLPNEKIVLNLAYILKIPKDKFTKYGHDSNGNYLLKNAFITPTRYDENGFVLYSNANLEDCSNALSDYQLELRLEDSAKVTSDLNLIQKEEYTYVYHGKNRLDFSLFIENKSSFTTFKSNNLEVITNFNENKLDDIQKAIAIEKIVAFVNAKIGVYPFDKIAVSQADYDRNPFYGLNQLPSFISPFRDDFMFEIKFLKTYLNNYIKNTLQLNARKDNWIFDAIQISVMMQFIDSYYPKEKMMGSVAKIGLVRGYHLVSLDFNEQYSYFYMLMARKNLDQPLSEPKNILIKFNEKIASKYRAGLSLKYLDSYLGNNVVPNSVREFYQLNLKRQTSRQDFENILNKNSTKNIDWYFNTIIDSREIIDYKFDSFTKTKDTVSFSLKNKTNANVPISIFGIKNKEIVSKIWIDDVQKDSIYTIARNGADKIVINYKNEVPEINLRNNWQSLKSFRISNKPIKFNFMKDLEDPFYNQILYVPTISFNIYDGLLPGMRLHNKTILDKPFLFDINPSYSTRTKSLSGSASVSINQYNRDRNLFNIRYTLSGSQFHYAEDAVYTRFNPSVNLRIRSSIFRDNRIQSIQFRQVLVNREKSDLVTASDENYSVFNARYFNVKTELTNHLDINTDLQMASKFGKVAGEIGFRRLFDNNRTINLRLFAGVFLYNSTQNDYFSFGLDRPTDYLFDYNYLGRSESTGLVSQQIYIAEGGFKSILNRRFANQFMTTFNAGFNIWNWIEVYGDAGLIKDKGNPAQFVYDSGIRLNLVTDYFELYLPVQSSNGFEIGKPNYTEKIRFVVTLNPGTLIKLFTRKWF